VQISIEKNLLLWLWGVLLDSVRERMRITDWISVGRLIAILFGGLFVFSGLEDLIPAYRGVFQNDAGERDSPNSPLNPMTSPLLFSGELLKFNLCWRITFECGYCARSFAYTGGWADV
jgi:hypothetical protein